MFPFVQCENGIPLLEKEGWLRRQEKESDPKWRRRGGRSPAMLRREQIRNEGEPEPQKAQKAQETYVLLVPFVVSSSGLRIHSHLGRGESIVPFSFTCPFEAEHFLDGLRIQDTVLLDPTALRSGDTVRKV